jgi:multidrug efflux pump subunit AcrB
MHLPCPGGDADRADRKISAAGRSRIRQIYALLVILFQSRVDPLIIMVAVPGALIGMVGAHVAG